MHGGVASQFRAFGSMIFVVVRQWLAAAMLVDVLCCLHLCFHPCIAALLASSLLALLASSLLSHRIPFLHSLLFCLLSSCGLRAVSAAASCNAQHDVLHRTSRVGCVRCVGNLNRQSLRVVRGRHPFLQAVHDVVRRCQQLLQVERRWTQGLRQLFGHGKSRVPFHHRVQLRQGPQTRLAQRLDRHTVLLRWRLLTLARRGPTHH